MEEHKSVRKNRRIVSSLFNFVYKYHNQIQGDIVEAGVFRGNSLVAMGLMLKELGSNKKVFGFDSFSGFPPIYHPNDDLSKFEQLFTLGCISKKHIDDVRKNIQIKKKLLCAIMIIE